MNENIFKKNFSWLDKYQIDSNKFCNVVSEVSSSVDNPVCLLH